MAGGLVGLVPILVFTEALLTLAQGFGVWVFACMCVCVPHSCGARLGHRVPWDWSVRQLAAMWALGIEPGPRA